jgi:hypothetical protein
VGTGPYEPRIPPEQTIVAIYNKNPGKNILGSLILRPIKIAFIITMNIIKPNEIKKIKKYIFVKKFFLMWKCFLDKLL